MKKNDVQKLNHTLKVLLPKGISYALKTYDSTVSGKSFAEYRIAHPLSKRELQAIGRTVPKREIEYRTGRFLVKKLLGLNPTNTQTMLYKKPNGAPNWPKGITGSISHSSSICVAAISNTKKFSGIGLDLEQGKFEHNDNQYIARSCELSDYPGHLSYPAMLRTVFCCKEAIYKSLESILVESLDFRDVAIQFASTVESNILEFDFKVNREMPNLKTSGNQNFYGRVYANEKLAVSIAAFYTPAN